MGANGTGWCGGSVRGYLVDIYDNDGSDARLCGNVMLVDEVVE